MGIQIKRRVGRDAWRKGDFAVCKVQVGRIQTRQSVPCKKSRMADGGEHDGYVMSYFSRQMKTIEKEERKRKKSAGTSNLSLCFSHWAPGGKYT